MLRPGSKHEIGSVCKVGTQDPENLDEEVKPLVTVWCGESQQNSQIISFISSFWALSPALTRYACKKLSW